MLRSAANHADKALETSPWIYHRLPYLRPCRSGERAAWRARADQEI